MLPDSASGVNSESDSGIVSLSSIFTCLKLIYLPGKGFVSKTLLLVLPAFSLSPSVSEMMPSVLLLVTNKLTLEWPVSLLCTDPRGRSTSWSRWRPRWRAPPRPERSRRTTAGTRSYGSRLTGSWWTYMTVDSTNTPSDHRNIKQWWLDSAVRTVFHLENYRFLIWAILLSCRRCSARKSSNTSLKSCSGSVSRTLTVVILKSAVTQF